MQEEWARIVDAEEHGDGGDDNSGNDQEDTETNYRADSGSSDDGDVDAEYSDQDVDPDGGEHARRSLEGTLKGLRETQGQLKNLVKRAHRLQKAQQSVADGAANMVESDGVEESER